MTFLYSSIYMINFDHFRHYCDNATTSEDDMRNNKKCPAGRYCVAGLDSEPAADDCATGHYCPEGEPWTFYAYLFFNLVFFQESKSTLYILFYCSYTCIYFSVKIDYEHWVLWSLVSHCWFRNHAWLVVGHLQRNGSYWLVIQESSLGEPTKKMLKQVNKLTNKKMYFEICYFTIQVLLKWSIVQSVRWEPPSVLAPWPTAKPVQLDIIVWRNRQVQPELVFRDITVQLTWPILTELIHHTLGRMVMTW